MERFTLHPQTIEFLEIGCPNDELDLPAKGTKVMAQTAGPIDYVVYQSRRNPGQIRIFVATEESIEEVFGSSETNQSAS